MSDNDDKCDDAATLLAEFCGGATRVVTTQEAGLAELEGSGWVAQEETLFVIRAGRSEEEHSWEPGWDMIGLGQSPIEAAENAIDWLSDDA